MLRAAALSDVGRGRRVNEDWFVCDDKLGLFAIADGMGGHSAGEIASRLAIEAVASFILRSQDDQEFSWPYGLDPALSYDANRLRTAIHLANRRVFRAAETRDDYTGMGTTIVAALVANGRVAVGHVGDSRLYHLGADGLRRVTHDDSWVEMLQTRQGAPLTATAQHSMRHVLTNVLGVRSETDLHLVEEPLHPKELLVLCSDGLHGVVDDATITQTLRAGGDVRALTRRLVDEALARDTHDNVTVLVVGDDGSG